MGIVLLVSPLSTPFRSVRVFYFVSEIEMHNLLLLLLLLLIIHYAPACAFENDDNEIMESSLKFKITFEYSSYEIILCIKHRDTDTRHYTDTDTS